jgi:hypothetical protein
LLRTSKESRASVFPSHLPTTFPPSPSPAQSNVPVPILHNYVQNRDEGLTDRVQERRDERKVTNILPNECCGNESSPTENLQNLYVENFLLKNDMQGFGSGFNGFVEPYRYPDRNRIKRKEQGEHKEKIYNFFVEN